MSFIAINFDGLIGPTHNYGGLSLGNVASHRNAGAVSRPRAAALQGLAKMRALMDLGLEQGFFLPHDRPSVNGSGGWASTGTTTRCSPPRTLRTRRC